jgi:hypothetical protein
MQPETAAQARGAEPPHEPAITRLPVASEVTAFVIEIFGISAGVLVMSRPGFLFRAAHSAFVELDGSCFRSVAHAERAVHSQWTRFQHRPRPGFRLSGRGV